MKIYVVNQGIMTSTGSGDMANYGMFTNKANALKHFNEIKEDIRGYNKPPHGYLETEIEVYEGKLDVPMDQWILLDILEYNKFRWWK